MFTSFVYEKQLLSGVLNEKKYLEANFALLVRSIFILSLPVQIHIKT